MCRETLAVGRADVPYAFDPSRQAEADFADGRHRARQEIELPKSDEFNDCPLPSSEDASRRVSRDFGFVRQADGRREQPNSMSASPTHLGSIKGISRDLARVYNFERDGAPHGIESSHEGEVMHERQAPGPARSTVDARPMPELSVPVRGYPRARVPDRGTGTRYRGGEADNLAAESTQTATAWGWELGVPNAHEGVARPISARTKPAMWSEGRLVQPCPAKTPAVLSEPQGGEIV